ncbi:tripartite ATP-independent transporter DctP family solute receptor [Bradyrhizobium japonicum]|nr:tripartite ATP-independent transporter DctP family solute receptor [Bradyrhizobium japonicum]MCP1864953.1 tripartite ATP-independent transporter DctP family solute receptor [Bradyrhizobium japonicum]MCP1896273.1 tripartite ATP-independent transporter DctP family solute receptor [Bradyrhizobium japonicum]MCW2329660.1 tripartite ATP-independent transporter DctP family solute receptor [Bradyrhizobium japonicum]
MPVRFKGLALVAAIGAVALGAMGPASAQAIQERTIRWGHLNNTDHPVSKGVQKFAEIVAAKSGGKLKVREYPANQLGSEMQQQSALRAGTQEMQSPATTSLVGIVKDYGLIDFPFIVSTPQQADALLDGPLGAALLAKLPEKGLVGLAYWDLGFRNVTNSKRAITRGEDLGGIKIRVIPNPVYLETFKAFNANPVPMSFSELYSALETGTVDGQENPFSVILSNKFFEVQKYLSVTNHTYSTNIILISKKFWDGLSPDEQKIRRHRGARLPAQGQPRAGHGRDRRAQGQGHGRQRDRTRRARSHAREDKADRGKILGRLRPRHRQAVQQ